MFRDSRGVVHTVSAPDPLDDLPSGAAAALQEALLRPVQGDLGGALERCEAVGELLERWQDAFFAALPDDVDLEEEARWAAEAGLSLADVEAEHEDEDDPYDVYDDDDEDDGPDVDWASLQDAAGGTGTGPLGADLGLDLSETTAPADPDDPRAVLDEDLVGLLERELLLLPLRVRLEALVAAGDLVATWADLLADHEKLLGHLVLAHAAAPQARDHAALADVHAALHAGTGPAHPGSLTDADADTGADSETGPDADAGPAET